MGALEAEAAAARADAIRTVTDYPATGPQQARLQAEFLAALTDRADAISRFGPPAHLTVGVAVLDPSGRRVLLTHHRKADAWYQFGGHIEPGDASLRAAAERELREESGLTDLALSARPVHLDRHALPGAFGTCREHLDVRYAAVAAADAVPLVSPESYDVRWFDLDALPPGTADDLGGLLAAARLALPELLAGPVAGGPR
ncbi:MAG: NUDIX domain-containing protein [Actinobacteria bacterium]|nr:NUDIX domain-containing protein [Actinomycetota bacterium]